MDLPTLLRGWLPLTDEDVERVLRLAVPQQYARGDHVYLEGKPVERVFLMREGLARVYYVHDDREVNLRLLADASVLVPLAALITGTPAQESIQALADTDGWFIPLRALERGDRQEFLLERCRRLLAEQHYLSMERRLRMLQHKSAEERWLAFRAWMPERIVRETPGYHVASYLGITPESLSRVRRGG